MVDQMPVPAFPVYGMTESYIGERWMNVWNLLWSPDGPLWMVVLGHGNPHGSRQVGVITDAKLGQYPTDYGFVGPTGLDDVRRMACLEMIVLGTSAAERDSVEFQSAVEMAGNAGSGFDTSQSQIDVDGLDIPTSVCRYRSAWAASADLGPVAIALFGVDTSPDDVVLTTVNDRLVDYGQPPGS